MSVKNLKPILVIGGAGYIGSHMVLKLMSKNFVPVILDNLSTSHRNHVVNAEFIQGDMADSALIEQILISRPFLAVMHFASFIEVNESINDPGKYYQNNVVNTLNLLQVLVKRKIKHFIFSSSAAVYGNPLYTPIDEGHPLAPTSPYGRTKLIVEQMLGDFAHSDDLRSISLRYFNAAGADPEGRAGERRLHESHLIPLILKVVNREHDAITIYGQDYSTADGTCVRDYVHVDDLCQAHLQALLALLDGSQNKTYNLGNGKGYSVQQVIDMASQITSTNINVNIGNRRIGDPAILIADPSRAKQELHWQPQYPELQSMIEHTWRFLRQY